MFDPEMDTVELGEPVTFDSYRVPVESLDAFRVSEMLGRRAGAAAIPRTDFGWVCIDGELRRVYATRHEYAVRLVPPGHPATRHVTPQHLLRDDPWLADRTAAGAVERAGPIPPTSTYERRTITNRLP